MARRRMSLLTLVSLGAPFVMPTNAGGSILDNLLSQNWTGAVDSAKERFLGIGTDGVFHIEYVVKTYVPIVVAALISKILTRLGVNRKIPREIPFIF